MVTQQRLNDLQRVLAHGEPVFVLGPGCHRVGFDDPGDPGWQEVQRRLCLLHEKASQEERHFLKEFLLSKVSDERRRHSRRGVLRFLDSEGDRSVEPSTFDPYRTLLASHVLSAFRHASCCLGAIIAAGQSPVLDWQGVAVPKDSAGNWARAAAKKDPWAGHSAASPGNPEPNEQQYHFTATANAVRRASDLATGITDLHHGRTLEPGPQEAVQGLPGPLSEALDGRVEAGAFFPKQSKQALLALRIPDIEGMLQTMVTACFSEQPDLPLVGSHVEWLGDLLWHVLSSDARIPPSQAELAFYVNVGEHAVMSRYGFNRTFPGDYRVDPDPADGIHRLMSASYPMTPPQWRSSESLLPRERMVRTIAASMVAQWRLARDKKSARRTIALVSDYEDYLEQALLALLPEDAQCHIVLPVWVQPGSGTVSSPGDPGLRWLFGTASPRMDGQLKKIRWSFLERLGPQDVRGPVVIKLNGAHRIPLKGGTFSGTAAEIGLCAETDSLAETTVGLATIFTEHHMLLATHSFESLSGATHGDKGLAGELFGTAGLSWNGRSWLIMGQRFADWLPRLRLFTGLGLGRPGTTNTEKKGLGVKPLEGVEHWAIDRGFDWPERGLLRALNLTLVEGDLADIANVHAVGDAAETDEEVQRLVEEFEGVFRF